MSGNNQYKHIILGCGEAGRYISWTLAKSGQKTAVIERQYIGGSCPNMACLPSKKIIYSAKIVEICQKADEFGIIADNVCVDKASVFRRRRSMVDGLIETGIHTHIEALNLNRLPRHLIVLGGGYVGLEMAHAFRRFGSKVTIIEYGSQIAQREE